MTVINGVRTDMSARSEESAQQTCRLCQRKGRISIATFVRNGTPVCDDCNKSMDAVEKNLVGPDEEEHEIEPEENEDEYDVRINKDFEEEEGEKTLVWDQEQDIDVAQSQIQNKKENRMKGAINWESLAARRFVDGESVGKLAKEVGVSDASVYLNTNKVKSKVGKGLKEKNKKLAKIHSANGHGSDGPYTEAINSLMARHAELGNQQIQIAQEQERLEEIIDSLKETAGH
jgi:hypothetical protein